MGVPSLLGSAWCTAMASSLPTVALRQMSMRSLSSLPVGKSVNVDNVNEALRLLRSQPNHYVVASITGRTFVLSQSDLVTVPRLKGVQVGDVLELDLVHEVGSRDYTLRAQDPAQGRRKPEGGKFPLVLTRNGADGSYAVRAATEQQVSNAVEGEMLPFSQSWAAQLIPSGMAHIGKGLSNDIVKVRCVVVEHTKGPMERILKFKRRKGYDKVITHKQPYTRVRVDTITLG
ncbi:hypothetical protein MCAP1_001906 [Malassezia caprae]|uniref:Large ribosomal subunit protein bL21m n=1 Tax=Malassezia caprae TaxID=1381934 RepID=A0AAF0E8C5_9BASI|nr:hypothetical protein MCAP1_001906 [Malassezia caprae]